MNTPFRTATLAFLLLACTSCARTNIESLKQPDYQFTSNRLLVIEQLEANPIQQGFTTSFPEFMNACGVKTFTEILPDRTVNTYHSQEPIRNAIATHVQRENIDTVLQISFTSALVKMAYGAPAGTFSYDYNVTLKNLEDKKLWTSTVTLSPNILLAGGILGTNTKDMGTTLARDIVQQLKNDGVLTHCPEKQ